MSEALRVLYLEENPDHIALVTESLSVQFPALHLENISLIPEAIDCLGKYSYDVVLISSHLAGESTLPRLFELSAAAGNTPIIVIAGDGDEKSAANAIKQGATDYIIKSRETLEVLPYLLQRMIKHRRPTEQMDPIPTKPIDHLLDRIDTLSRRVHHLQNETTHDGVISQVRDEIQKLQQFANQLAKEIRSKK